MSISSHSVSLTNATIREAVALWCSDPVQAKALYGPIESWDVHQVTNMAGLFRGQDKFNDDIGGWDVSQVTDTSGMFEGATSFSQKLDRWNIARATITKETPLAVVVGYFRRLPTDICREIRQMMWVPLTDKTIREAVQAWVWSREEALQRYGPIELWDVRQVKNMNQLFKGRSSFNADLSRWDVSNVLTMKEMFAGASSFNGPIGNWNVGQVTDICKSIVDAGHIDIAICVCVLVLTCFVCLLQRICLRRRRCLISRYPRGMSPR